METALLLGETILALGFFVFIFRANLERMQNLGILSRGRGRLSFRNGVRRGSL